jgi:hypothetical protein
VHEVDEVVLAGRWDFAQSEALAGQMVASSDVCCAVWRCSCCRQAVTVHQRRERLQG